MRVTSQLNKILVDSNRQDGIEGLQAIHSQKNQKATKRFHTNALRGFYPLTQTFLFPYRLSLFFSLGCPTPARLERELDNNWFSCNR